eukprot:6630767-Alexandrium_andersonii.AAC.1
MCIRDRLRAVLQPRAPGHLHFKTSSRRAPAASPRPSSGRAPARAPGLPRAGRHLRISGILFRAALRPRASGPLRAALRPRAPGSSPRASSTGPRTFRPE